MMRVSLLSILSFATTALSQKAVLNEGTSNSNVVKATTKMNVLMISVDDLRPSGVSAILHVWYGAHVTHCVVMKVMTTNNCIPLVFGRRRLVSLKSK